MTRAHASQGPFLRGRTAAAELRSVSQTLWIAGSEETANKPELWREGRIWQSEYAWNLLLPKMDELHESGENAMHSSLGEIFI